MREGTESEAFSPPIIWRVLVVVSGAVPTLVFVGGQIWLLGKMPADLFAYPVQPWGLPLGVRILLELPLGFSPLGISWLLLRLGTIVITAEGLTLHRVSRIRWAEVTSARVQTILGSRYLVVEQRRRPFRLKVSLDYVGTRRLEAALPEVVPDGNPIRGALDRKADRVQ